jgi:septal ring factor EnvC (AmiA/AmiB activator)
MSIPERRHRRQIVAAALLASACVIPVLTGSATGDSITQLQNKLGAAQQQLDSNTHHEQTLSNRIAQLNSQVASLTGQISFVQSREAEARARLASYEAKLGVTKVRIARERRHLKRLHHVLARSVSALKAVLVSEYEQPQESVVTLVINSSGFQQLLDGLQYMSSARDAEQHIIVATRAARDDTQKATNHLSSLQRSEETAAKDASTQTNAMAGMNQLLSSQKAALADEQSAQGAALAASKAKGATLQAAIASIEKQQAAAEAAAQAVTLPGAGGATIVPTGGWAIPYPIVLCESGGQDLPPNRAGASGYYQIIPSTWREFGGSGPAAYLAPKSEQDAVASRIWNNGAGASNWACAAIVGIT